MQPPHASNAAVGIPERPNGTTQAPDPQLPDTLRLEELLLGSQKPSFLVGSRKLIMMYYFCYHYYHYSIVDILYMCVCVYMYIHTYTLLGFS